MDNVVRLHLFIVYVALVITMALLALLANELDSVKSELTKPPVAEVNVGSFSTYPKGAPGWLEHQKHKTMMDADLEFVGRNSGHPSQRLKGK